MRRDESGVGEGRADAVSARERKPQESRKTALDKSRMNGNELGGKDAC